MFLVNIKLSLNITTYKNITKRVTDKNINLTMYNLLALGRE
jgi:protein subunit release factor A